MKVKRHRLQAYFTDCRGYHADISLYDIEYNGRMYTIMGCVKCGKVRRG